MSWLTQAISMLRVLINDLETVPTYSDSRLTTLLMTSSLLVQQDLGFTYTIDYTAETITPDPINDLNFMTFMIIKAACQADFSTYRTKALLDGITAKLGPASLSTDGTLKGFKDLLAIGPCQTYENMKRDYVFGSGNLAMAILSPFIGNNFNPSDLNNYLDNYRTN